jgi:subtilisin
MRSRHVHVAVLIALSLQLVLLPLGEVAVTDAQRDLAVGLATTAKEQPRPQGAATTRQAKKGQKAKKKQKQARQRARQARTVNQRDARKRKQRAAARQTAQGTPRADKPAQFMGGGPLMSGQREVAQLEAKSQDPGERYIIVFSNDRANSRVMATALDTATPGVIPIHIYEHVISGFAAYLTPEAKQSLAQDPRVASITRDVRFQAAEPAGQTVPRGVTRVGANTDPVARIDGQDQRVDVDIAILDSGVDVDHPDLNVFAYFDCTETSTIPGWDENGHGTHVAGVAAALDNNIGVVGVAPGARIWSFRVLDAENIGNLSDIVRCVDLVAHHAHEPVDGETIDVANMSLSGPIPSAACGALDAFHDAICAMVDAGVTTVVAAGNNGDDAANYAPGNNARVITVSALADSDGQRGALGEPYFDPCLTLWGPQPDDSLAEFSNFGATVDIAAPGVGVLSTFPTYIDMQSDGCDPTAEPGYEVKSGTSMASPHVAGAAGLLLSRNPGLSPDQVRARLLANRDRVALPGDPDGINEGVLNLRSLWEKGPPKPGKKRNSNAIKITGSTRARVGQKVRLHVTVKDTSEVSRVVLYRCTPQCKVVARDRTAPYLFEREPRSPGRHTYRVRVYDTQGNYSEQVREIVVKPKKQE